MAPTRQCTRSASAEAREERRAAERAAAAQRERDYAAERLRQEKLDEHSNKLQRDAEEEMRRQAKEAQENSLAGRTSRIPQSEIKQTNLYRGVKEFVSSSAKCFGMHVAGALEHRQTHTEHDAGSMPFPISPTLQPR